MGRIERIFFRLRGVFSESAINVFSSESRTVLGFAFIKIFPFSGIFILTYYFYLNEISPKGFSFGDLVPFALAAINFLVVIFFFLLGSFVFGVLIGLLVVAFSRSFVSIWIGVSFGGFGWLRLRVLIGGSIVSIWSGACFGWSGWLRLRVLICRIIFCKDFLARVACSIFWLILLIFTFYFINKSLLNIVIAQMEQLRLAGVFLNDAYLSWLTISFFIVFCLFFVNIFDVAYRRSLETDLVRMESIKVDMVPHSISFFAAILGAIAFMPVGWPDALVNRVVEKSGLRVSYSLLQLDSEVYDAIENNEYDVYARMVGCKGEGYGSLNAARLVWHGFGDASYVKLVRSVNAKTDCSAKDARGCGGVIEIPSSAIKLIARAPKKAKYCRDFVGSYFSMNSARAGNDFDELRDFVEVVPNQFNIGVIESIDIEWAADPIYSRLGNYELSKARAGVVKNLLYAKYCRGYGGFNFHESCKESKWDEIVKIKPMGATSAQFSCKDWPSSKTKNECLEKNRGGRLVFYVKSFYD